MRDDHARDYVEASHRRSVGSRPDRRRPPAAVVIRVIAHIRRSRRLGRAAGDARGHVHAHDRRAAGPSPISRAACASPVGGAALVRPCGERRRHHHHRGEWHAWITRQRWGRWARYGRRPEHAVGCRGRSAWERLHSGCGQQCRPQGCSRHRDDQHLCGAAAGRGGLRRGDRCGRRRVPGDAGQPERGALQRRGHRDGCRR